MILKLNGTLDYETTKQYTLIVRAYDGERRFGDLTVNIAVTDVNDEIPHFEHSKYDAQVQETAIIGTFIFSFTFRPFSDF